MQPIARLRSARKTKFEAPHQPEAEASEIAEVVFMPDFPAHQALQDLAGFSHIWLIWCFDRNKRDWKPMVKPPRGPQFSRGVLATRSPHRPNPLGLTLVKLLAVEPQKGLLTIGANDLLNDTAILDIKPYLPKYDAPAGNEVRAGWVAELESNLMQSVEFQIERSEKFHQQAAWLAAQGLGFLERAENLLRRDPSVNRTRRISRKSDGHFCLASGRWRIHFELDGEIVRLMEILSVYSSERLATLTAADVPDYQLHVQYLNQFPAGR